MARVKNAGQLRIDLTRLGTAIGAEVNSAVYAAADIITAEAAVSITRGSTSGKNHVPSLPGQPPNNDTGVLVGGLITKADPARYAAQSISQAPYSAHLEYGTSRMAARPFLRPALANKTPDAIALIKQAVARAVRKA